MKGAIAAILIGVALSACGAGAGTTGTGRISGHVTSRACGGAARENQPACRFQPTAGITLAFKNAAGRIVATVITDRDGAYGLDLLPGTYSVAPKDPAALGPARNWTGPVTVVVAAGRTVTADYSYTVQLL